MSHPLLQVRDLLSLSFTKFKTRRIRTALTLISTSVLALILVVASSVMTGVMKAASETPQAELTDLHLSEEWNSSYGPEAATPNVAQSLDETRKRISSRYPLRNVYVEVSDNKGDTATLDLLPSKTPNSTTSSGSGWTGWVNYGNGVVGRSTDLLQPFVDKSQNLNWKQGEPLPVFVPTSALTEIYGDELKKIKEPKERVAKRQSYQNALIGKTGKLTIKHHDTVSSPSMTPTTTVESETTESEETPSPQVKETPPTVVDVRVVGFLSGSSSFFSGSTISDFVFPYEIAQQVPAINSNLNWIRSTYASFENTADRNAYVKATSNASIYADPLEENKQYFKGAKKAFNIAVLVMLILLAIPMAATVSKLLSDSQRETGVFRAIGARNHHILGIYTWYVVQMCIGSFLIALIIGELICAWLTSKYASGLELAAADFVDTVLHISFINFNVKQLSVIFLGMVAGGMLGSAIPLLRAMRRDPIKALRDE